MAAAKGSDSRQGLIVALVISILFAVTLAVTTYFGYAGQEQLRADAKKAKESENAMKKGLEWNQFLATLYKAYLGQASKDDMNTLSALRNRYDTGGLGKGEKNFAENDAKWHHQSSIKDDVIAKMEKELAA